MGDRQQVSVDQLYWLRLRSKIHGQMPRSKIEVAFECHKLDGQPVAAISSIGAGLHAKTMTSLINLQEYDRDIKSSIDAPSMHLPEFGNNGMATQCVFAGDFSEELIDSVKELGLRINVQASGIKSREGRGYVVGASIDPSSGERAKPWRRTCSMHQRWGKIKGLIRQVAVVR